MRSFVDSSADRRGLLSGRDQLSSVRCECLQLSTNGLDAIGAAQNRRSIFSNRLDEI